MKNLMKSKKVLWGLAILAMCGVAFFAFAGLSTAFGIFDNEPKAGVKDYIAYLESRNAELENSNASQTATINEPKQDTVISGLVAELSSTPSGSKTSNANDYVEPSTFDGIYYNSIDELVADYRSGVWDGRGICRCPNSNLRARLDTSGELEEGRFNEEGGYYDFSGTGIYPDLPDGYTWDNCVQGKYIQRWYNCATDVFTCLESDGVHCYHCGRETNFWPIVNITEESQLFSFHRYNLCVIVDGKAIQCADDGETLIISTGIIGFQVYDGGSTEIFTFNDGEIQFWGCYRNSDLYRTIIGNITAAACTSNIPFEDDYRLNIIFTDADGRTYFVNFDDIDIWSTIREEDFNTELLYQHYLGKETPEYYVSEYRIIEDSYREAWYNGERNQPGPSEQFLAKYCGSCSSN